MKLLNTSLWNTIEGARSTLDGIKHYDPVLDAELVIPPKDKKLYADAYAYCYRALYHYMAIDDMINEIRLTKNFIEEAPVFNERLPEFSLDCLLNYAYKNWLIRINTLGELIIHLAVHIYQIRVQSVKSELAEEVFNSKEVREDNRLNLALLGLVDFLKIKRIENTAGKTIRRNRNNIAHKGEFSHKITKDLSILLFEYQYGLKERYDETDLLIDKNLAAIDIEKEVKKITQGFYEKLGVLFELFENKFNEKFNSFLKKGNEKS